MSAPRIDVIAPSGALLSAAGFGAGVARLEALGCRVRSRVPGSPWLRFAGSDDARLAQVHDAARADDVDLVMIARGGYGLSRLLDRIDWPLVARSVARGVRWVGFSDFTVFQLALLAGTGAASWAGPAVCGDFGAGEPEPYMLAQFAELLQGRAPVVEWAADPRAGDGGDGAGDGLGAAGPGAAGLVLPAMPAAIEGTLWGGNLAMLASLAGTPWMPAVDGGILFVEDVAEHPYRVERMLLQLLHAGVLGRQKAILLGAFTEWRPAPHDNGFDLSTVRAHLADRLGIPVVPGLPFGHVRRRAVLGVGLRYRLERMSGDVGAAAFRLSAA
ncbi:LD-carboxypeptidase [Zeimonas arvi]|uniref:LD-carboxypeptidase n=1 Tax=Zeimonas arvi TaxID=2498847 RepID=A0A5C8NZA3_9BURK|nr:LD-carboxypeptidase [Zeimonas arvi]TXL66422.1 LD-carboxypeptidase [Zeimonas arvi]